MAKFEAEFPQCSVSAPGKAILFGEHAVVYGVTAIAASLSDLRIHVNCSHFENCGISVNLADVIDGAGRAFNGYISFDQIKRILPKPESWLDKLSPATDKKKELIPTTSQIECLEKVPTASQIESLRNEFGNSGSAASQCLMAIAYLVSCILPEVVYCSLLGHSGLRLDVRSACLPIGAGLGSSAAFSVALAGVLLRAREKIMGDISFFSGDLSTSTFVANGNFFPCCPKEEILDIINGWAYASEVVIHGTPSGLDNTTSCYGGAVKFRKGEKSFERLSSLPQFQIILTNTKVPRSTKKLVASVRELHDKYSSIVQPIFDSIEGISQAFLSLLTSRHLSDSLENDLEDTVERTAELMRINHSLLCSLGVGHPALDSVCALSIECGASCKLTGAGGGGCAITLLPFSSRVSKEELITKIRLLGYEAIESSLGGQGVLCHS